MSSIQLVSFKTDKVESNIMKQFFQKKLMHITAYD